LVRDGETRAVLASTAEYIGVASNNVAEYGGLVAGLTLAVGIDPDARIEVRMDSKLVVEQMSGRWKIKHDDMKRLAAQARSVVDPGQVRYTWIPREQNKDADRLANEALDDAARNRPWRGAARPVAAVAPTIIPAMPPDLAAATTLLLLRHGVTQHTVERRFSGRGGVDLPLTDDGRAQALAAGHALQAAGGVDFVLASPLLRTRQTAEIAAGVLGVDVHIDEGWAECAFGEWDGLTGAEVVQRWPGELAAWQRSTAVAPPGGESIDAVGHRALQARDAVIAQHPRARVLVVTHATPIRQLVRAALGAGPEALWRLESTPAALTMTRWWQDGGASLAAYNESGHLAGLVQT
jgi:probable phosphoglycerate mutase